MKTITIGAEYYDVEMLERASAETNDPDVRVTLMLLAERMQSAAQRGVRADFPRCATCKNWNEMEDYAKDFDIKHRVGWCEAVRITNATGTGQKEPMHQHSESADWVITDPVYFFNPGEDFGCVLHTDIQGKRPGMPSPRLKIKCDR